MNRSRATRVISTKRNRPAVLVAAPRQVGSRGSSIISRTQGAISRIFNNPVALVAAAICLVLAASGTTNPFSQIISKFATKLQAIEAWKWLGDFIAKNVDQTIGAVALSTSVLVSARPSERTAYLFGAVAFAYLVPSYSAWAFGFTAAGLALFLQLRTMEDRLVIGIACLVCYIWAAAESTVQSAQGTRVSG